MIPTEDGEERVEVRTYHLILSVRRAPLYKKTERDLHISRTSKSLVPPSISILFPKISVLARCLQLHDGHFNVSGDGSVMMKIYYADGRGEFFVVVFVVVVLHHAAGQCHTC